MTRSRKFDKAPDGAVIRELPTRVFHWLLVLLLAASWASLKLGEMDCHMLCGLAILTLLLFRLVWGSWAAATRSFRASCAVPALSFAMQRRCRYGRSSHTPVTTHRGDGSYS